MCTVQAAAMTTTNRGTITATNTTMNTASIAHTRPTNTITATTITTMTM